MRTQQKQKLRQLRRWRIRKKVNGTKDCPRMSVCITNQNIYVQFIDDVAGVTLAAASSLSKAAPDRDKLAANAHNWASASYAEFDGNPPFLLGRYCADIVRGVPH